MGRPPPSPPTAGVPSSDHAKLGELMAKQRQSQPLRVLSGCLLVSFLMGFAFVGGVVGALAIARAFGWAR